MKSLQILLLCFIIFTSCKNAKNPNEDNPPPTNTNKIEITELKIPSIYYVDNTESFSIEGKGFKNDDIIILRDKINNKQINGSIQTLNSNSLIIKASESITNGKYEIFIKRESETKLLSEINFIRAFNSKIPDKEGMTIKGTIYSKGNGLANVIVSDGQYIAKTDINGIYYLPSTKRNGYVFVSIPSNYEVETLNSAPKFYKNLSFDSNTVEIVDFELIESNNENHIVAFLPDMHIANRNDDISQFKNGFANDINTLYSTAKSQNKKFYAITLGDQTWDVYWYSNNYSLPEFKNLIKDFQFPIYHVIGNHDNDPYITNDFLAENKFRSTFGPTYYSFNIGKIHYIVLDNNLWINKGGSNGVIGERDYDATITQNQIDWLKLDLETITDKTTPIVIAMHIPYHSAPTTNNTYSARITNANDLKNILTPFTNVKIMSGHTHYNFRIDDNTTKITEYNIGAISATWWWTGRSGYANNHICKDGSPGGYGVLDNKGAKQEFYYKSIGFDKNYQFRTYDLNNVHITAQNFTPNANSTYQSKVNDYAGEYATKKSSNEVMLNIWGYSPKWKISVKEGDNELAIQRVSKLDPLHIISYQMKRLNVNAEPTSSFITSNTTHMFIVKANSPNSTLDIKVEDENGNVYTEKMIRPKAFTTAIK